MIEVTEQNFQTSVLDSELPVLLDVWATWCGPCKAMLPRLEALASSRQDIRVAKLNADTNRDLLKTLGVSNISTLILFSEGEEIARHVGMPPFGLSEFVTLGLKEFGKKISK
jgi:thioredoxin 1